MLPARPQRPFGTRLAFALLLVVATGCSGGGSALGDQPVLAGQISNWSFGSGYTLKAILYGVATPLATSSVDASGRFMLMLTGSAAVTPYLQTQSKLPATPSSCTGSVSGSPTEYGTQQLILVATNGTAQHAVLEYNIVTDKSSPSFGATYIMFNYSDRDFDETGEIDCPNSHGGTDRESFDIHYKTGWNRTLLFTSSDSSGNIQKTSTGSEPDGAQWVTQ